ncbi:MAG: hypothetical protein QOD81_2591 [Solirubrobacteraceae bacterium]|jgi:hypothetical protein|nr:hypothetical protein [Solirubrobacteraceae bacterium]
MARSNAVADLAAAVGRGLVAGAVGTAAMTVSSTVEQKLRGREASTAPADAAAKVLGIESFCDDAAKNRFSTAVHWAYGTGWGVPRALLRHAGLGPLAAGAAHGAVLWGSEQVMLPALSVAPPLWEWGVTEVAIDAGHHLVYTVAAGVAYEALRAGAR